MKKFTKIMGLSLALIMLLGLCACGGNTTPSTAPSTEPSTAPSTAPSTEPSTEPEFTTIESGKLIMATNAQFPPYELVSDGAGFEGTGFEGIDVEIAYALAQKLGLELVIDDMDFDGAIMAVQQGRCDIVLAGLTYNEERDQVMDFSDCYAKGVQVVIVPEGSDIASLDDLAGKQIGTQRATTGWIYTSDEFGDDAVTAYDDGATAVQALMNGQVDCVVIDNAPAQEYVNANAGLKILSTEYANEDYCLAVNDGNTELLEALNAALVELIDDGTVESIIETYVPSEK